MPSVQELLLALQGQKSPLVNLLEGVAGGYADAQKNRIDNAKKLMEMDQMRQQQAQQAQMQKQIADQLEAQTQSGLKGTGSPTAVLPTQKLETEISQDEKGNYSRKFKTVDTTPKIPDTLDEISAQQVRDGKMTLEQAYAQKKDKTSGGLDALTADKVRNGELTLEEAYKLKRAGEAAPSFQIIGGQDGKPVAVNPKTLETRTVTLPGQGPLTSTTQSDAQAQAKLYAQRMQEADKQLNDITSRTDLTSISSGIQGKAPNLLKSKDIQLAEQAKGNFASAVLRKESGAAISASEYAQVNKQYFPQVGDSPDVIKQKALNRKTAIEGLRNSAGEISTTGSASSGESAGAYLHTATNPKTGEKVGTRDGKTWEKI